MIAGSATLSNCDGPQADAAHLELWVAHASKRTHLNDAVQGVTAKVIVGPHVAVCSSSASATCEGEGSAAQHAPTHTVFLAPVFHTVFLALDATRARATY